MSDHTPPSPDQRASVRQKAGIGLLVISPLLMIVTPFLLLMPIYSLVGSNLPETAIEARLDTIQLLLQASFLTGVACLAGGLLLLLSKKKKN